MSSPRNHILNEPDLNNSLNTFFSSSKQLSQIIYLIILALLTTMAIGMAIVQIPVYIHTRGILRPANEVNQIIAPVSGIINEIKASENQFVSKGQAILILESAKEELYKSLLTDELELIHLWLKDLKELAANNNINPLLITDKYRIKFELYNQEITSIDLKLNLAESEYNKFRNLFEEEFISEKEYDEAFLKYKSLFNEKNKLVSENQMQITNELNEMILKESELRKKISEINYYLEKSVIRAPVSGIIQGIRNNYPGEYCSVGIDVCKLIPDTVLIAELYISPKDIGYISAGQYVRLLIDSYDYKYWGTMNAQCVSISEDIELIDNQALFRVICELTNTPWLEYRNARVKPGKGMTFTAQFLIMKRNLWQLLRDQAYNLVLQEKSKKSE
jgi:HlyD family secretion protein